MLIEEDLKYNGESNIAAIHGRLSDVAEEDIRKIVYRMVKEGTLTTLGAKRNRSYALAKKK